MMISENEAGLKNTTDIPNLAPPPREFDISRNERDIFLLSSYFVIRFNENGDIIDLDVSRISSLSEEEATEMAQDAHEIPDRTGIQGKFRYAILGSRMAGRTTVVFLDTSVMRSKHLLPLSMPIPKLWIFIMAKTSGVKISKSK